jgi:hypothetical protein
LELSPLAYDSPALTDRFDLSKKRGHEAFFFPAVIVFV